MDKKILVELLGKHVHETLDAQLTALLVNELCPEDKLVEPEDSDVGFEPWIKPGEPRPKDVEPKHVVPPWSDDDVSAPKVAKPQVTRKHK